MVRKQKLFGRIDKVRTLVEGVGRVQEAYRSLCHIIGGQQVSGQNVHMEAYVTYVHSGCQVKKYLCFFFFRVKKVAQLALQELNLISQFNFNLVLPDIIANKTHGESAPPGKFVFQSHVSKPFASTPCLVDLVFLFFDFAYDLFFVYVITRTSNLFPRSRSEFRSVLWKIDASK